MSTEMTYALIIIAFLVSMMVIGYLVSLRIKSAEDWWIAGRGLGILPSVGSYFATIISSVSMVGYVGYYYGIGWSGWWNWAGTVVTTIICAAWFAARLRRFGKVTLPDFFEERYGRTHSLFAAFLILFAAMGFVCAQLVACGTLINISTGIDWLWGMIIVGTVFILYTMFGGMFAVAWTDVFCTAMIYVGAWIMAIVILGKVGGFEALHVQLAQTKPTFLSPTGGGAMGLGVIISWIVTWGIGNFGTPHFITRFYACKDERVARLSQGWTGVTFIFFFTPIMLIGLGAAIVFPGIANVDTVTPTVLTQLLSPGLAGIVIAAIIAASVSTASGILLMAGTTYIRDIYSKLINKNADDRKLLYMSRMVTVIIGVLAMIMSVVIQSTVMWIQANMVGIMGAALAMPLLIGFAWKRANAQGAMAGIIVGALTAALWYALNKPFGWFPILPGIITSSLAIIITSLLTKPAPVEIQRAFFPDQTAVGAQSQSLKG